MPGTPSRLDGSGMGAYDLCHAGTRAWERATTSQLHQAGFGPISPLTKCRKSYPVPSLPLSYSAWAPAPHPRASQRGEMQRSPLGGHLNPRPGTLGDESKGPAYRKSCFSRARAGSTWEPQPFKGGRLEKQKSWLKGGKKPNISTL